ncbi:restriction endonuclease [Saccharibacillus sp. CPCC 101409]|uniref:restriction endonuclease n=1 Tax=Saccharibacillus sp. CPCC 101409 TaxID=3058041 RepID=UPI002671C8FF|nr:restriction endonuclease [Saccharibacillus sp. CPCC 101409]MDO3408598.1 restriction endonuclease [Saccharibacillus sp. CPCC 101409]
MARRKSKAKQQEEFLQGVMGLAAVVPGGAAWYLTNSLKVAAIVAGIGIAVAILILIQVAMAKAERLRRSGIAQIDQMDGVKFEQYLGHLFRSQGYKAEVTQASGDYGADLILTKDGRRIAVQAKRYKKNVGLKAVQEIKAAKAHYRAAEAWVVTNSRYTEQAKKLAESNGVRLIAREELVEMLLAMRQKTSGTDRSGKQSAAGKTSA